MFVLMLKTTENSATNLDFICAATSRDEAVRQIDHQFGELQPSGHGNYRMLGARGQAPKEVEETKTWGGSSYVLAEF